jgi:hypothetical protein
MSRPLFIQADSRTLNPTLDEETIARASADDPEAAASEWGGQFRSDISEYLPDALIDTAIVPGRTQLPVLNQWFYTAFVDMSGGVSDAAALAIAHQERGERAEYIVLDRLLVRPAPHDPEEVAFGFAVVMQRYGVRHVTGDRYAASWCSRAFKRAGIAYEPSTLDKSSIYTECIPLFAQERVELLDDPKLITQLRLLERRPRSGGRPDSIDHGSRGHDDAVNAALGAIWLASLKKPHGGSSSRLQRPAYSLM